VFILTESEIGSIVWLDLTVPNAEEIKDFYCEVIGWNSTDHPVSDYTDYNITLPDSGDTITGICHARGENAKIPSQWMLYVKVDDIDARVKKCVELGGEIIDGPREVCGDTMCIIRDPAGAYMGLVAKLADAAES